MMFSSQNRGYPGGVGKGARVVLRFWSNWSECQEHGHCALWKFKESSIYELFSIPVIYQRFTLKKISRQ